MFVRFLLFFFVQTASITCTGGSFQCDNGQCITATWLCDENPDCKDASDEKKEICCKF